MLGISFTELMVIIILALVIIGPKELPDLIRSIIRITVKARKLIKQTFQETGLQQITEEIREDFEKQSREIEEQTTTIIDLYGNPHQVPNPKAMRGDKSEEELKAEIAKYNKINSKNKSKNNNSNSRGGTKS